jgi:hypothetical protein
LSDDETARSNRVRQHGLAWSYFEKLPLSPMRAVIRI